MESEEEQHTTTLLCMGFSDAAAIRRALRLAKNDINEAVALLTNERPGLLYEPMDSGGGGGETSGQGGPQQSGGGGSRGGGDGDSSGGVNGGGGSGTSGFDPPPAYHEVVENEVRGRCGEGRASGGASPGIWSDPMPGQFGDRRSGMAHPQRCSE